MHCREPCDRKLKMYLQIRIQRQTATLCMLINLVTDVDSSNIKHGNCIEIFVFLNWSGNLEWLLLWASEMSYFLVSTRFNYGKP